MKNSEFETELRKRAERAGVTIPPDFAAKAGRYYELLSQWNRTTNLTALTLENYPARTLDRLLVEPLQAAELAASDVGAVCVDVGSGGGSPAIPFAIARPLIRVTMVESVAKKSAFLREACRVVEIENCEVVTGRVEDFAAERKQFADLVLIRGVRLDEAMALALSRLVKPGGRLLAFGPSSEGLFPDWRVVNRRALSAESDLVVFQMSVR